MNRYDEIVKIHDPLYELSSLRVKEHGQLLDMLSDGQREKGNLYSEILQTYELTRSNYLKQAGLSWLRFPSAHHTRFTHAIGTYTLGGFACEHVMVKQIGPSTSKRGSTISSLGDWLSRAGHRWKEEFLLSLLLHDVGHLPFSHVLEDNLTSRDVGFKSHEELGLHLILGQGFYYEQAKVKASRYGLNNLADVLAKYGERGRPLSIATRIMKNLLAGTDCDLRYQPINELVHGVADLDRIDHYNRDSYFMGLKLANTNVRGLLENLVLEIDPEPRVVVMEEGEQHLLQLLFARQQLWVAALDNDIVRAYEAMLNAAVSGGIAEGLDPKELPLLTDDELLNLLSEYPRCQALISRLLGKRPYFMLHKQEGVELPREHIEARFLEWRSQYGFNSDEVLIWFPPGYRQQVSPWLYQKVYVSVGGRLSSVQDRSPSLIQYLEKEESSRRRAVRVFSWEEFQEDKKKSLRDYVFGEAQ